MVLRVRNACVAAPSSVISTAHCEEFCCSTAFTPVTSVPLNTALSRTYLLPAESHDTIWLPVSSHWASCWVYPTVACHLESTLPFLPGVQTSLRNSFIVAALTRPAFP